MKYFFSILFCISLAYGYSQNTIYVNDSVSVTANFDLVKIINQHKEKNENTDEIKGYRIQIISDNNREKVYAEKAKVYQYFSEFKSYLKYVQPYYKLRIGDFKTRLEARNYLEKVVKVFPSAFIVFDDIKVR